MDAVKTRQVKAELESVGYSAEYLKTWQPKIDLYIHKPILNASGVESLPVGSMILNQPGHPDHVARKSRIGWLPWPPAVTCRCKACRERDWSDQNGHETPPKTDHPHQFGKAVGSTCKVEGCMAVRVTPYKSRRARH